MVVLSSGQYRPRLQLKRSFGPLASILYKRVAGIYPVPGLRAGPLDECMLGAICKVGKGSRVRRLLVAEGVFLAAFQFVSATQGAPLSNIPEGTQLVLRRPLTFSVGESRVYFQDGEPVPLSAVSLWRPSCYLKRSEPFDTTFAAEPNSYGVLNVQQGVVDEWGQGTVTFWTEIDLGSVRQGIRSLRCEIWTDNAERNAYLSEAEFVSVVGSWMYFQSPGEGNSPSN
jgi:hypothetical protein